MSYLLSLGRELAAPTQAATAKFNLENISVLAEHLGHPEQQISVSAHCRNQRQRVDGGVSGSDAARGGIIAAGFTLRRIWNESMNGFEWTASRNRDEAFAEVFTRIHELIEKLLADGTLRAHPTFFECVTAMAFLYFAEAGVDFAVFEVGLGGRLDSTNIVTPQVSVITRIDLDHENFLGHSLREIAGRKGRYHQADGAGGDC